jgi:hypothetical protein
MKTIADDAVDLGVGFMATLVRRTWSQSGHLGVVAYRFWRRL